MQHRKELREKERNDMLQHPIVKNNLTFKPEQVQLLYSLFQMFSDSAKTADVREIVATAKTLALNQSYPFIFDGLNRASVELDGMRVTFVQLVEILSNILGNSSTLEGRKCMFSLVDRDMEGKFRFNDLKQLGSMLGHTLTDEQIEKIIVSVSGKGKKDISYDKFQAYLKNEQEKRNTYK